MPSRSADVATTRSKAQKGATCKLDPLDETIIGTRKQEPLEEIIIDARKQKLSQLHLEIEKSEDAFYDTYNQVNTAPEYQVRCRVEMSTEMRMRTHVCTPRFADTAGEAEVQGILRGYPEKPASMVINEKLQDYNKHLRDLVLKDPKLRAALLDYYALTKHYEDVRGEKFKGKWFVWD